MIKAFSDRKFPAPQLRRRSMCPALLAAGLLIEVPGYPVYYAPDLDANLFFYDGVYWVYSQDGWYASSWYDGPWDLIEPEYVPYFVLRVPVRYYRRPQSEGPPQHSQQPHGKPENTDKHDKSDKSDKPDKPKGHDR